MLHVAFEVCLTVGRRAQALKAGASNAVFCSFRALRTAGDTSHHDLMLHV